MARNMPAASPSTLPPLHLIGCFDDPYTGAERQLPDLARCLEGRRKTMLWSSVAPHPHYVRQGVRPILAYGGQAPRGGMVLIGGVHLFTSLDPWLKHVRPQRLALRYNLAKHSALYAMIGRLRELTDGLEPELLFVSRALQLGAGLPGTIERSLIRLEPYLSSPIERPAGRPFTFGRVSRDALNKHHPDDAALYRQMAARGYRVRLMGATCLKPWLAEVPGIELLPAGAETVADFYSTLDVMFYRTGSFMEAYGRVVFEAMASGLPVVVAASGGYAECIAHAEDGFVFDTQEQAIHLVEQLAASPGMRQQVGLAARRKALELHGPQAIEAQLQFFLRA
jgi:glycosyltransferase involved in cell wall biosynthesis